MDAAQAAREAAGGGLVGIGCEAHEAKAAARKERWVDKRKGRSEWRQVVKTRRTEGTRGARVEDVADEEVAIRAAG
jgi:tRNA-dihydrouridine synthase 1